MSRRELIAAVVVLGAVAGTRAWWEPRGAAGVPIEVTGDVPHPGLVIADAATLPAALSAAGVDPTGIPDLPVPLGAVYVGLDGPRDVPAAAAGLVGGARPERPPRGRAPRARRAVHDSAELAARASWWRR